MKKFLLIDANALIHRAFHALPPLTGPSGEPTGAIYGLTSTLLKTLKDHAPNYVAAAFDRPEPTFRKEAFKEYKAHRPPSPQELISQIIKAHELFREFGIVTLEKAGFEADDIIGTLVQKTQDAKELKIIILTGDLDTLQLVKNDTVVVQTPKKGLSETIIYNEQAVKERFGLSPKQMPDYKGLVGDPSDNIPGIKGVGPKTAEKLLREFNNIEALYKNIDSSHPLAKKILPHKEQALFSKNLATIHTSVPLEEINLESFAYKNLDLAKLTKYLTTLGFASIVNRLLKPNLDSKPKPPELFGKNGDQVPKNVIFIKNLDAAIKNKNSLFSDEIKVCHDWKNTIKQLGKQKIVVRGPFFDLMIASWLLDPDQKDFSPEALSERFLHEPFSGSGEEMLFRLFDFLKKKIADYELTTLFENIEMPLLPILAEMETTGIKLNKNALFSLKTDIEKELNELTQNIYKEAGGVFNINSPRQVAKVVFQKLNLAPGKSKKTASGQLSTSENVLLGLKNRHPIIDLILDYRENFKIKTGFVEPLLQLLDEDGRVRTTFIQTGTATGRIASEKPNLQNIPQESKWAAGLRKCFVAEDGKNFISFDYSQLELRLLAHVARDQKLIQAFLENEDVHSLTASQVFNVPPKEVTPAMRRLGKTLNFGVVYGMGARGFSQTSGLETAEAEQFIVEYFHDFPEIQAWQEKTKSGAHAQGYVLNLNNRRRWLPEISSANPRLNAEMERRAINMPIQSLGADIIKLAMIQSNKFIREHPRFKNGARLLLSIHDELLFEVQNDILKEIAPLLQGIMESIYKLVVPLKVEIKTGESWGKMKNF